MSKQVNRKPYLDPSIWAGRMKNVPCFILGNGPSINDIENLSVLDSYFTVGINRIFYKYDPTILLWQDMALWIQEHDKLLRTEAIKYVRKGAETCGGFYGFTLQGRDPKLTERPDILYGRGSSGTVAWELANCLGCNPIVLIGMDCSYRDGITDFYGKNPMHKPHTLPNCRNGLLFIQRSKGDRTVINCSDNNVFEKLSFSDAIKKINEINENKLYSRQELKNMLGVNF